MNLLGTTGTRNISLLQYEQYATFLLSEEMESFFDQFDGFVSGGCVGWDALFGEAMAASYANARRHVIVVPANRTQLDPWWNKYLDDIDFEFVEMEPGTTYKQRNKMIVNLSEQIYYCADWPEEHGKSTRSGTWQTVRLARAAAMPVSGFVIHREVQA